jgi:BMFP domain-containing protein YqiC
MKAELRDGLVGLVESLRGVAFTKANADSLVEALAIAKAAIPSGDLAADVADIGALWSGVTPPPDDWIKAGEALERLAKQAQAAKTWFAKWEQAETLLRECREKDHTNAARGGAMTADAVAGLEQEKRNALSDRDRHANTAEVWRKRVHEAAEALADVLPGEVGRLDLVSRINELKRQMAARERDVMTHFEAKNEALERVKELEARCARLSAAGQVLSEHVNKEPPITVAEWKAMSDDRSVAALVPPGWTARDEFARAAMQGMVARIPVSEDPALIAAVAYHMADAMLKAGTTR